MWGKKILADENMTRLFSPNWEEILRELEAMGYHIKRFPSHLRGAPDEDVIDYILTNNFDGIITEDTDFYETHRSNLYWKLINKGKMVLVVKRVNPNSPRGEVRIYEHTRSGKREILRRTIKY